MTVMQTDGTPFTFNVGYDSTQALNLLGSLTLWDGKSYLSITPNLSAKRNKHGKFTTYVNVKECLGPGQWSDLRYDAGNADWGTLHEDLREELETHPIYQDWVRESSTEGGPWDALSAYLVGLKYVPYSGQQTYNDLLSKAAKKPVADFSAEDWSNAVGWMTKAKEKELIPNSMEADYDPFADE
jgi:hypothetical protein